MRFPVAAIAVAALVLVVSPARAATLHVPADYPAIQAAVLAASAGDTVLVAPGRYRELIQMKDGVVLRSADGPDTTFIVSPCLAEKLIDERAVEVPEGCGRSTVIEGFSFDPDKCPGSAIYVDHADPTIRGNKMLPSWGWGINLRYSKALIEHNLIDAANTFGILVRASSPEIYNNEIRNCVPRAIVIVGKDSKPIIGGSPEHGNKLYGNVRSVSNESVNDIDATWNDWGWETASEMDQKGYPADIVAIFDHNEESGEGADRGTVDYRHWVSARDKPVPGAEPVEGRSVPWVLIVAAGLAVGVVLVSRRRANT